MSFPATANFVGEFLIFIGIFDKNPFIMFLSAMSIFLGAIYSIWCWNRVCFGTLKIETETIVEHADVNRKECIILCYLLIGMLILGVYSSGITDLTDTGAQNLLAAISSKR